MQFCHTKATLINNQWCVVSNVVVLLVKLWGVNWKTSTVWHPKDELNTLTDDIKHQFSFVHSTVLFCCAVYKDMHFLIMCLPFYPDLFWLNGKEKLLLEQRLLVKLWKKNWFWCHVNTRLNTRNSNGSTKIKTSNQSAKTVWYEQLFLNIRSHILGKSNICKERRRMKMSRDKAARRCKEEKQRRRQRSILSSQ